MRKHVCVTHIQYNLYTLYIKQRKTYQELYHRRRHNRIHAYSLPGLNRLSYSQTSCFNQILFMEDTAYLSVPRFISFSAMNRLLFVLNI